jgi:hypothetical protein
MQAIDLLQQIKQLPRVQENSGMRQLVADLESQAAEWARRQKNAQESRTRMHHAFQRLREAVAGLNSTLLDHDVQSPGMVKLMDPELTRVINLAETVVRWPAPAAVRPGPADETLHRQLQRTLGLWIHKLELRVPDSLPALNIDLGGLAWPALTQLVSALAPSIDDFLHGAGLKVSAAMVNPEGKKQIELTFREAGDLNLSVHPETFCFPRDHAAAIPEPLVHHLIECDFLVRRMGESLSVTSAPGEGAEIILRFPANNYC